jgi:acetolactate synthase I/II/III large subunit
MGGTVVATAVEQDLPLVWVVLNNRSLQIERELMLRLYGRQSFCDYRLNRTGELWNPDFCKWADAMGAGATKVTRPGSSLRHCAARSALARPTSSMST